MKVWEVLALLIFAVILVTSVMSCYSQLQKCEDRGLDGMILNYQVVCMPKGTRP